MSYFSTHNHSSYSNIRGLDAILRLDEMIQYANDIGLAGICLSEHEFLGSHLKFLNAHKKLKKAGKIREDFRVGLGNEIYLVHEGSLEELKENIANKNPMTKFYHFLLLARNERGHKQLRELSSIAWNNHFTSFGVERVPTFKSDLKKIVKQGDVIATTACLGSFLSQCIIKLYNSESQEQKLHYNMLIDEFINFCIDVFGKEYFYLEIQPSNNPEQIIVNKALIKLCGRYDLGYTVATDGHYLKKEDRSVHKTYLQSQDAEREVDSFYESTFIQSEEEVREYLSYLSEEQLQLAFDNTMKIYHQMEEYDLEQPTIIPTPEIPEYNFEHILNKGYEKYPYIEKFSSSEYPIDRYFLHLIQQGLVEKIVKGRKADKEYFQKCLDRINTELREIWFISEKLNERVSSYYVLVSQIVDSIWNEGDSIVGVSRGSAGGYLTVYLVGITQMNPLDYDLPHFRHLTAERPELPDIDLDSEQGKRAKILDALKQKYSHEKVLNIATFSTEGSRSALLSSARGMGIDVDEVGYLTSLIPVERGFTWSLQDCFFGDKEKGRKPITELVNAVNKYEGLMETSLKIEGLIKARSVHASGVYIFQDKFTTQNAMMRSASGQPTTQFDMKDSDSMGALKVDMLTVQALDRVRYALDSLIEFGYIEELGSLKETYDSVLHPDVLEYEDKEMWKKVGDNKILDLFQFDTPVGLQCAKKIKPESVEELSASNSIMRLMSDGQEQPMDKFVRFKENPQDWLDEMKSYNLTDDEIKVIKKHLSVVYGVGDSQEILMRLSMDEKISNFTVKQANELRKIVGKKLMDKIPEIKELFFNKGMETGNSRNILNYVWETQVSMQLGYSFSSLHSTGYSLIALQEMNLATKYPDVFWSTACLSVSASASDEEGFVADDMEKKNKSTNYGKIALSIAKVKQHGVSVSQPLVNKANFGFTPDIETNSIIFGLKGINGIGDEVAHTIIANRPYASFEDFYERVYKMNMIQKKHVTQLIKAGAFNEFDEPVQIMKRFIIKEVGFKESLNMQNMKAIISMGLLDTPELHIYKELFNFREYINKSVVRVEKTPNSRSKSGFSEDKILGLDEIAKEFYEKTFDGISVIGYNYIALEISEKQFTKEYNEKMKDFKDNIITSKEFVKKYNETLFKNEWYKVARGSVSKWEMDSISYYESEHELANVNKEKYNIVNFFELDEEPVVVGYTHFKDKQIPKQKIFTIMGTVLDKNPTRHTITVLTPDGVVTVKTHSGAFAHYNKQISRKVGNADKKEVIEKSWFTRGNLVLLNGYRRDEQFLLKTYKVKGEPTSHTINLIKGVEKNGDLILQDERASAY